MISPVWHSRRQQEGGANSVNTLQENEYLLFKKEIPVVVH